MINNNKIYIGVDPGAKGAIVALRGYEFLDRYIVPSKKVKSLKASKNKKGEYTLDKLNRKIYPMKDVIDEIAFAELIQRIKIKYPDAVVILEKVKNITSVGAVSNFNFGYNFGFSKALLISVGYKVFLTTPQNWQKHILIDSDAVFVQGKVKANGKPEKDTKASSLKAFKRIFPNQDMRATERSTVYHNGLVDAALIAKFGQITDVIATTDSSFDDDF